MVTTFNGRIIVIKIDGKALYMNVYGVPPAKTSSVVGGSLDGAVIPTGTRDGQLLIWDSIRQRWIG